MAEMVLPSPRSELVTRIVRGSGFGLPRFTVKSSFRISKAASESVCSS